MPLQFPFGASRLSPDGQRITYVSTGREWQVYVYDVKTGTNSRLTTEGMATRSIWTLSLDGQRFLMTKLEQTKPTPVTEMILVQNWFEELKRLVPTGK